MRKKKNRIAAFLLALFVGWIGIHRFYLRQKTLGVIYVILLFTAVSFLLGIIDAIAFAAMSDEEFDRRYNKRWNEKNYVHRQRFPTRSRRHEQSSSRSNKDSNQSRRLEELKKKGKVLFKSYETEEAKEIFLSALEMNEKDIALHFNLACCYSVLEEAEQAYIHLEKAIALGFDDLEKISTHPSLAYLRIQENWPERFQQWQLVDKETDVRNVFDQLKALANARQDGVINEAEYRRKKEALLEGKAGNSDNS